MLINVTTLRKAEWLIESCEACNPEGAEIPFDNILDRIGIKSERDGLHPRSAVEMPELPSRDPRKDSDRADVISEPVGAVVMASPVVWVSHPASQDEYAVVISV